MKNYIGITIGPIFDTIMDAVSPAALWFASTLFSDVTRRLCIDIKSEFEANDVTIYSPFFDEADRNGLKDGVGKYHDRVIFSISGADGKEICTRLDAVIKKIKKETVNNFSNEMFGQEKDVTKDQAGEFLQKYLMIDYVVIDETRLGDSNCILKLSPYLDELELMQVYHAGDQVNPIKKMFKGKENGKNRYVKTSEMYQHLTDQAKARLQNPAGDFKSLEDISGHVANPDRNTPKYTNYYAVVAADGDNMGKFLKSVGNDTEKITSFSEGCLDYANEAAKKIYEFGGLPIYAGGDDLLFLAPIVHENKTIVSLCKGIADLFDNTVKKKITSNAIPTISFGVSVQYYKYPLYEAMSRARAMLDKAKDVPEGASKNQTAILLEKHSGQSTGLVIGNENVEILEAMLTKYLAVEADADEQLRSIGTKLHQFKALVNVIDDAYLKQQNADKEKVELTIEKNNEHYPWDNIFDNDGQTKNTEYLRFVQDWYYDKFYARGVRAELLEQNDKEDETDIDKLLAVLRLTRFLTEKGAAND